MPLVETDIQILASQRLEDVDNGGGRMTADLVQDGAENAVFDDISELDRAYGRISLRKLFLAVRTPSVERYYGAHVVIADPFADVLTSLALFSTRDWDDTRADARDRIEQYLARGPRYQGYLYELQVQGSKALTLHQREGAPLPAVGDVLVLVYHEGEVDEAEQYVRVTRVTESVQTFSTQQVGEFRRRIVALEISDPLRQDFPGIPVSPYDDATSPTIVRRSVVADAARYYGIRPLTGTPALGSTEVQAVGILQPLVPSALAEVPINDLVAGATQAALVASGAVLRMATSISGALVHLGRPLTPGSVAISGTAELIDRGDGTADNGSLTALIDYRAGRVTLPLAGVWTVDAAPAADVTGAAETAAQSVTTGNRGYVWTYSASPILPAPGTFTVDYLAQGQWYRLQDDGSGRLDGAGAGTGTVNYVSGAVSITLTALPDVGSQLLYAWSSGYHYTRRDGESAAPPAYTLTLTAGIEPSSLTITWLQGGVTKTATDNGSGILTGNASGFVHYLIGEVWMVLSALPDPNTTLSCTYQVRTASSGSWENPSDQTTVGFTLDAAMLPARPGSVVVTVPVRIGNEWSHADVNLTATDNGSGGLTGTSISAGTVNYTTGAVSISIAASQAARLRVPDANGRLTKTDLTAWPATVPAEALITWWARKDVAPAAQSATLALGPIVLNLAPSTQEVIVPTGVQFRLGTDRYVDRSGLLYRNPSPTTGAGTLVGAIDYASRRVTINVAPSGPAGVLTVEGLLTRYVPAPAVTIAGRVATAPVKPGVTQVVAVAADGSVISATDNGSGAIVATELAGTIVAATGVYSLRFGRSVPDSSLTIEQKAEPWYDADDVVGGMIWRPKAVLPETVKITTVGTRYLPLDAGLLGLDPVRLPPDGRVSVIRVGDLVVIHHTAELTGVGLGSGSVVNVGRTRIARARVLDAAGRVFPPDRYEVNYAAGVLTFDNPLDTAGYTSPYRVRHTIADQAVAVDVEIGGRVALNKPLSHNYPSGSYVSSALLIGDMYAGTTDPFSQGAWTGEWSDALIGSAPFAQYDYVLWPIEVTNDGATEERWLIQFTSASAFKLIGERLGQIATGDINTDLAVDNPATGAPYFTLRSAGWSDGWIPGNSLRFNTRAANYPMWLARTLLAGESTVSPDAFSLLVLGNKDAP